MISTLPIQQVVTKKRNQQWRIGWRGQFPLWIPQEQFYIHIEIKFGQLRISRHSHDPTPALTALDYPGAANDHFIRKGISALFCAPQLYFPWRRYFK